LSRNVQRPKSDDVPPGRSITAGNLYPILYAKTFPEGGSSCSSYVDPKQAPADLLRNILEPSAKINDKYYAYLFEMESRRVLTGLIVEETSEVVKIVENPLASTEPKVLKKSEISSRKQSPASIMPNGLLDKLTREEMLDLISYIAASDPNHPLFQRDHAAGHGHGAQGRH